MFVQSTVDKDKKLSLLHQEESPISEACVGRLAFGNTIEPRDLGCVEAALVSPRMVTMHWKQ